MTSFKPPIGSLALATLFAATAVGLAAPASAAVGDWAEGAKVKVRLLATHAAEGGRLAAGVEVLIPPGWKTYWRNPGEAGIAPIFDFSASRNLAPAEIGFPVPHRYSDSFLTYNVYEGRVVFIVDADVPNPAEASDLVLALELGVCELVCIPDSVEARLTVPAGDRDPQAEQILADARALLPGQPEPGTFFVADISRDGGSDMRPEYRIDAVIPAIIGADIFVEGPTDWFPAAPAEFDGEADGYARYRIAFSRVGSKTPIPDAEFRVTIVSDGRAIEQVVAPDASGY